MKRLTTIFAAVGLAAVAGAAGAQTLTPLRVIGEATIDAPNGVIASCGFRITGTALRPGSTNDLDVIDGSIAVWKDADKAAPSAGVKFAYKTGFVDKGVDQLTLSGRDVSWLRVGNLPTLVPTNGVTYPAVTGIGYRLYIAGIDRALAAIYALAGGTSFRVSFKGGGSGDLTFSGAPVVAATVREALTSCLRELGIEADRLAAAQMVTQAAITPQPSAAPSSGPDPAAPVPEFQTPDARLAYLRWLGELSERLKGAIPDWPTRKEFLQTVWYEGTRQGIDLPTVLATIGVLSEFRKFAVNNKGARGYMAVAPAWARSIGDGDVTKLFHTQTNLRYGTVVLRRYLDESNDDLHVALEKYIAVSMALPAKDARVQATTAKVFAARASLVFNDARP